MSLEFHEYGAGFRKWRPWLAGTLLTWIEIGNLHAHDLSEDSDEMPVYWELQHSLNATQADDYVDFDMDGVPNSH